MILSPQCDGSKRLEGRVLKEGNGKALEPGWMLTSPVLRNLNQSLEVMGSRRGL